MNEKLLKTILNGIPNGLKVLGANYDNNDPQDNYSDVGEITGMFLKENEYYINDNVYGIEHIKPFLRNLKDVNIEINHQGNKFTPLDVVCTELTTISKKTILLLIEEGDLGYLPHNIVKRLIKWNFNVFGLEDGEYIKVTNEDIINE